MGKINCWEYMQCGREIGGSKIDAHHGVCRAATFEAADGFWGGRNGGRACMFITGTLCNGKLSGTYREKSKECHRCEFMKMLVAEHGSSSPEIFYRYVHSQR